MGKTLGKKKPCDSLNNITDKAKQWSLCLDLIGDATLDIFEQLHNTGRDLVGAINALLKKFNES